MSDSESEWIDVTIPIREGMVHWPGTPEIGVGLLSDVEKGDPYSIRSLALDSHTGTHMDAPAHFVPGGATIDMMPPGITCGRARVFDIGDPISIKPEELSLFEIARGERVIFKTINSWRCWQKDDFFEDYVHLSYEAAVYLVKHEVAMVGIDYLSIASFETEVMIATHRKLLKAGIYIIEGLDLRGVGAGDYEILALPLRLAGGDGSPCRAFLRPI
jgi:arylformamidase